MVPNSGQILQRWPKHIHLAEHPLIQQKIGVLRNRHTSKGVFRSVAKEVSSLLFYEMLRHAPTQMEQVEGILEKADAPILKDNFSLVLILRAALGMGEGIVDLLPDVRIGHIGLVRDETTLEAHQYYAKFPPDIKQTRVLLADPMLATGNSAAMALELLAEQGIECHELLCLFSAPEGIHQLKSKFPQLHIWTAVIDDHLNDQGFIVPGVGDFGDRLFGTD